MRKIVAFSLLFLGFSRIIMAQEIEKKPLTISGYLELYYQYDFSNPVNNSRPTFVYSHTRNNEVSLNLGIIKANFSLDKVRANLGIGIGSYMNANYASEEGVLKNTFEANIGVKLSKKYDLWLDAGVLPSHIGFESAIGADCYTLTRSMMAENSPYFETGAKLSYTSGNDQWNIAVLFLNGWQRIQRLQGNSTPAFGHQLSYHPNKKVTINSSSYIGNEQPDNLKKIRYFHNLYGQFQLNSKFALFTGFDVGLQQKQKSSSEFDTWYTPVIIAKYSPNPKVSIAMRSEYYIDLHQVIIETGSKKGFQTFGASLNVDYKITTNLVWRTEFKALRSKYAIFTNRADEIKNSNVNIATALAISF